MICLICMPSGFFGHTYQANPSYPCYNYYINSIVASYIKKPDMGECLHKSLPCHVKFISSMLVVFLVY